MGIVFVEANEASFSQDFEMLGSGGPGYGEEFDEGVIWRGAVLVEVIKDDNPAGIGDCF